jgi:hypothetical protein
MGESRARIGFGQVDLQIEEETGEAFGELDWDFPESSPPEPSSPGAQVADGNVNTRQTIRRDDEEMAAVVDSTRIVSHAAMSPVLEEERDKTPPPSSRLSGQHGVPSASGVEATGNRVAAMREAYARGDAEGALAIASTLATVPPPSGGIDHPDAAVQVEVGGEVEIEIDEEEPVHAKDLTRVAPSASIPRMSAVNAAQGGELTLASLTERQGIPRLLVGRHDIAKLPIDHRAGFLLGFIDGMQTMEEILDVCAMPESEALELIRTLVDMEVIEIE